jgi:uncharacterized lipoprotein NlpE involved in copper resistance
MAQNYAANGKPKLQVYSRYTFVKSGVRANKVRLAHRKYDQTGQDSRSWGQQHSVDTEADYLEVQAARYYRILRDTLSVLPQLSGTPSEEGGAESNVADESSQNNCEINARAHRKVGVEQYT